MASKISGASKKTDSEENVELEPHVLGSLEPLAIPDPDPEFPNLERSNQSDAESDQGPVELPPLRSTSLAVQTAPGSTRLAPQREDLLALWGDEEPATQGPLEQVRIGQSATIVVPFTTDTTLVTVHYCEEPELSGYVRCNGDGCTLCGIGKHLDERALLPVYSPTTRTVGVLPISPNSQVGALRPQILPILKSRTRQAMRICRVDRNRFKVESLPLTDDLDDGADIVARFMQRWEAGEIDLRSIYPSIDDETFAEIPSISVQLRFARKAR